MTPIKIPLEPKSIAKEAVVEVAKGFVYVTQYAKDIADEPIKLTPDQTDKLITALQEARKELK